MVDVVDAAAAVAPALGAGPVEQACLALQLEDDAELAAAAADVTGEDGIAELPASLVDLGEDCHRAVALVPAFVESAGSGASEGERRCLRDVFLAMSAEEREAVTAAAVAPGGTGGDEALAALSEQVDACR